MYLSIISWMVWIILIFLVSFLFNDPLWIPVSTKALRTFRTVFRVGSPRCYFSALGADDFFLCLILVTDIFTTAILSTPIFLALSDDAFSRFRFSDFLFNVTLWLAGMVVVPMLWLCVLDVFAHAALAPHHGFLGVFRVALNCDFFRRLDVLFATLGCFDRF